MPTYNTLFGPLTRTEIDNMVAMVGLPPDTWERQAAGLARHGVRRAKGADGVVADFVVTLCVRRFMEMEVSE